MQIAYIDSENRNWYFDKTYELLCSYGNVSRYNSYRQINGLQKFDVVFVEFLGGNTAEISQTKCNKLIVRTHGVEVYESNLAHIKWENIDWLLSLSQHQLSYLHKRMNKLVKGDLWFLPPPESKMHLKKSPHNKNVAFIAHITGRKGHDQIIDFLKSNPTYTLFCIGDICKYGGAVWEYVEWNLQRLNLGKNLKWIKHLPWENLNNWLENMSYIWLPSVEEGQSRVLLEGMCKGLRPIVRHWAGADELWPKDCIYESMNDVKSMLEMECNPAEYRNYAVEKFNCQTIKEQLGHYLND